MPRLTVLLLVLFFTLPAHRPLPRIPECYYNFPGLEGWKPQAPVIQSLFRQRYKTYGGEKRSHTIPIVDGASVRYWNDGGALFAEIEVERSDTKKFRPVLLEHYRYLGVHHYEPGMELGVQEQSVAGLSFYSAKAAADLSRPYPRFTWFPDEKTAVSISFRPLPEQHYPYQSPEAHVAARRRFLDAFAQHLASCGATP